MTPTTRLARARWWPGGLAWGLWTLAMVGFAGVPWMDRLLGQAGRPELAQWDAEHLIYALLGLVSAATVGAVLAARRPHHPVGWLLLGFGLVEAASLVARGYLVYGLLARPGILPATGAAVVIHAIGYSGADVAVLALALLLTPTGSLPSRRWRWVAGALVAVAVAMTIQAAFQPQPLKPPLQSATNPLAIDTLAGPLLVRLYELVFGVITVAFVPAILAAAASLVVRFWRAQGVERQQLRWVALAAGLAPVAALVAVVASLIGGPAATTVVNYAAGTVTWLIPLALGAAVLRYRLYDLDRIISRTLAWGLLTLVLGGGYAVVALVLGQVLGRDSSLVVAAATLTVAAAFQPVRHRIQAVVDRRFNRRHYDIAHTVAAFSGRLRQQVDLDELTAELLAVVEETMQPTQASLWLRPSDSAASNQRMRGTSSADGRPMAAGSAL